jgi:EmrB/QacA subfamily drug resistance transporter
MADTPARVATTSDESAPQPAGRNVYVMMSGLVIAILLAQLDAVIVGPAMPTIVGELGGLTHLAWVVTAYTLGLTVATPLWGKLGDMYARKATFLVSILVFLVGSALSGLATSMIELIGFRAVQGIGGGGLMVGVLAIIGEIVPPRERGRYTSLTVGAALVANIGGPLVGGYLTDHLSWRWAFFINIPLALVAMLVVWLTLHLPRRLRADVRIDWLGAVLLTLWISALVFIVSWGGGQVAWLSPGMLGLVAVVVLGFAGFVLVERRASAPIMPLALFRIRNFELSNVLGFAVGFATFGAITYLPQFQQLVQGASATGSGLLLLPMLGAVMVMNVLVGQLIARTGRYRIFPILGGVLLTVGMLLCALLRTDTSRLTSSIYMLVVGLGIGLLFLPSQTIAQNSVSVRDMGAATGANTLLRNLGGSIGVSLLGAVYVGQLRGDLTARLGEQGQRLLSGGTQLPPAVIQKMPVPVRDAFHLAVTNGVQDAFMICAVLGVVALAAAWFVHEVPLRGPAQRKAEKNTAE